MAREPRTDPKTYQVPKTPPIVWGPAESYEWAKTAYGHGRGKEKKREESIAKKAKAAIVLDFSDALLRVERRLIPNFVASECLRELRKQRFASVTRLSTKAHILSSVVDAPRDIDKCISFIMRDLPDSAKEAGIALSVERTKGKAAKANIRIIYIANEKYRLSLAFKGASAEGECKRLMRGLEKRLGSRYKVKISR